MEKQRRLLWLDLETTGMDPNRCGIIEVAWGICKPDATEFHIQDLVLHPGDAIWEKIAMRMHKNSGLFDECLEVDKNLTCSRFEAEQAIMSWLPDPEHEFEVYLAGSSVHFDMSFLRVHMPLLAERLHYRLFDVSAMKLGAEAHGHIFEVRKEKPHRAVDDIKASFELFQQIRAKFRGVVK